MAIMLLLLYQLRRITMTQRCWMTEKYTSYHRDPIDIVLAEWYIHVIFHQRSRVYSCQLFLASPLVPRCSCTSWPLFKLYSHAINSKYLILLQVFIHAFNLCMLTLFLQNPALFPHKACTSISRF